MWISVRTLGCEAGKSGWRDIRRATFILNRRRSWLNKSDYPKLSSQASNLQSFVAKQPLSLARRAMEPGHFLHPALTYPSSGNARRLKSRRPFVLAAQHLISSSDNSNTSAALWADHQWNAEWFASTTRLHTFIPDTGNSPPGMALPRTAWVRLSRLRTGVVRFCFCLHKWVWPPLRPVSVAQKNKPSNMLSFNVQFIDLPWNARPGGSGWWDNRLAAQHLLRDLVQPSSFSTTGSKDKATIRSFLLRRTLEIILASNFIRIRGRSGLTEVCCIYLSVNGPENDTWRHTVCSIPTDHGWWFNDVLMKATH